MFRNYQRTDEWENAEEAMKEYWMKHNTNSNVTWDDVKEEIRLGWLMARQFNQTRESIH